MATTKITKAANTAEKLASTETLIEITPENRNQYGGDCALLETMVDPVTGRELSLSRDQLDYLDQMSPLRGDLILKSDPLYEYNTVWFEENDSSSSRRDWMYFTLNKGFTVAQYDDWDIRPELQAMWLRDASGRITLGPSGKSSSTILMVRSKERWAAEMKKMRATGDRISRANEVGNLANQISSEAQMTESFVPEYRVN